MYCHRQTDEVDIKKNKHLSLNNVPSKRAKPTPDPENTNVHRPSLPLSPASLKEHSKLRHGHSQGYTDTRMCLGECSSSSPAQTRPALFLVKKEFHRPLRKLHACTSCKGAVPD